ncbi:hypothetical protein FOL47_000944 [Perkinsus chesapeaki]|uniref:Uncharacterized protein n=1 Tax=Perkinsus chesapeaki TaxID=330153 RepID=A0A6V1LJV8_PERCH|nr:hypothetical protein FOL47_000944 [Perkinsus chesapeaki]
MAVSVQAPEQVYEQHIESYEGAYTTSPMPQYGDAPMGMWHSVPIAPPLPSARDIAPMDFQQAFVHKCLYPSQSFLVSEGFAEEEREDEEVVVETKVRTPRRPREPQPDYFGHLLGHPLSADDDEDEDEKSDDDIDADHSQAEADVVDNIPEKPCEESPEEPECVQEAPEGEPEAGDPAVETPSESGKDDVVSDDSTEDADADYFGHIMGHPMVHNGSQRKSKTPKSKKDIESKKEIESKTQESDSQETQESVLGLFLGGVEVCDREENIGKFTARPGEETASAEPPVKPIEEPAVEAEKTPECDVLEEAPEVVNEPESSVPAKATEPTAPSRTEAAVPAKRNTSPLPVEQPSRDPEVVQPRSVQIEAKEYEKVARPPTELTSSGPARPAAKKKSFFAGLCGSRNQD